MSHYYCQRFVKVMLMANLILLWFINSSLWPKLLQKNVQKMAGQEVVLFQIIYCIILKMSSITSVLFSVTRWRRVSLSPGHGSLSNVTCSPPVTMSVTVVTVSPAMFVLAILDFKSKLIQIKLGLLSEWITRIGWGKRFLFVIFVNRS